MEFLRDQTTSVTQGTFESVAQRFVKNTIHLHLGYIVVIKTSSEYELVSRSNYAMFLGNNLSRKAISMIA